jgi:non-specific serine/threonine protein kinase
MVYLPRCHSPLNLAFTDESPLARSRTVVNVTLHISLLGRFRACADEQPVAELEQRRLQTLLAYILLHSPAQIPRQQIAFALWPESTDEQAQTNLRTLLHRLRAALPGSDPCLQFDRHRVWWRQDGAYRLDVADFEAALAAAAAAERIGNLPAARHALEAAAELYEGDLLPTCYDDWITPIRERLSQAAIRATERLTILLEEARDYVTAVSYAQRLLRTDPLNEPAYRHLMRLHALGGNRTGVVRVFNTCAAVLRQELGVAPDAETKAAYQAALDQAAVAVPPPHPSAGTGHGDLPPELTSFIGRERDLAQVRHLLQAHRLVTLTGSGGVGKTRLALRVASELRPEFSDGAWWVDLETVTDEALVTPTVATSLGMYVDAEGSTTQALSKWLADRHLLLVLDNCEHLAGRVGQMIQALLRSAPQLRVLVTSQHALGVSGETAWRLPSLTVPGTPPAEVPHENETPPDTMAGLGSCASVQLFIDRAQGVLPTFTLTTANAEAVAQICRRLDGIPLAIELAASRVRTLTPAQIAVRLADVLGLLARQATAVPARHSTLRATLDWSYSFLSAAERILFGRLAVFAGNFSLEAAEAVCAGHGILSERVLDLITGLEDKSLVESAPTHGQVRFRLHEIIRQYAAEKLAEAADDSRMRARHLDYYGRLVSEIEPKLTGPAQSEWLDRLEVEHDNLHAALVNCQAESGCLETGLRIVGRLTKFWSTRGHFREGRHWAKTLAAASQACPPSPGRVDVLRAVAYLAYLQGDYAESTPFYAEALCTAQAIDDKQAVARIYRGMGIVAHMQGDHETAQRQYEQSLSLSRELADREGEATCLVNLGVIAWHEGDLESAGTYAQQCLALRRVLHDEVGVAYVLYILGQIAWSADRPVEARTLHEESLRLKRPLDDKWGIANSLDSLGVIARRQGDPMRARACFSESLMLYRDLGSQWGLSEVFDHLAGLLADTAQSAHATQLMAAAAAIREATHSAIPPIARAEYQQQLTHIHDQFGDERFRAAWILGRALTIEQAVQLALETTAPARSAGALQA